VLVAGYLGFGALAAAHDIPLAVAVASTAVLWALPAQIVFVEMQSLGAPLAALVLAVMLSSARFLPMTVMLMPEMRDERHRAWKYYLAAQLLFEAVQKAGSVDPQKVKAAMAGLRFDSIVGPVSVGRDHQLVRPAYVAKVVKQGSGLGFEVVKTVPGEELRPQPSPDCKL